MFQAQEPKYMALGSQIVNRATRQPIPTSEPVFIFRAKDSLALVALQAYAAAGLTDVHRKMVDARITEFERFAHNNPDKMALPGTATPAAPLVYEVLQRGYCYQLTGGGILQFLRQERVGDDLITVANGTTTEEVLAVLIDRVTAQHEAVPCAESKDILLHLTMALTRHRERQAARDSQGLTGTTNAHAAEVAGADEQHGIEMTPCKSSNLEAHGYDKATATLALRFKGGAIYHYAGVPEHVAQGLASAPSVGSYASREITGKFEGVRMNQPTGGVAA